MNDATNDASCRDWIRPPSPTTRAYGAQIEEVATTHRRFARFPRQSTAIEFRDSTGLSTNKLAALRRMADALLSGVLDEASLVEGQPSPDAAARLCRIKGIGPWTATVILLRGLGRLDVFPMNDSSVARNFAFVSGSVPLDIDRVLTALGSQRGMLYYHLVLARLDARGDVGRASSTLLRSVQSQAQRHHRRGS